MPVRNRSLLLNDVTSGNNRRLPPGDLGISAEPVRTRGSCRLSAALAPASCTLVLCLASGCGSEELAYPSDPPVAACRSPMEMAGRLRR